MSNKNRTVLYIGVTSNLSARVWQHKYDEGAECTKKYNCTDLLYYEVFDRIEVAIAREKQLKKWKRTWKNQLIEKMNPELNDLYEQVRDCV